MTCHLQPADLSRGRGIFLFRELTDLMFDTLGVVQVYVPNPMTIDGYKFDLRVYAVVTSYHPLTVHVCREGLVRFGSERFNADDIASIHAQVTNTSLNKTRAAGDCKVGLFVFVELSREGTSIKAHSYIGNDPLTPPIPVVL